MKELNYIEYTIISNEEVTIFTPTKVKVMKKVKKDRNGYYVRGGYWYPSYKLYLKDYEKKKGIKIWESSAFALATSNDMEVLKNISSLLKEMEKW